MQTRTDVERSTLPRWVRGQRIRDAVVLATVASTIVLGGCAVDAGVTASRAEPITTEPAPTTTTAPTTTSPSPTTTQPPATRPATDLPAVQPSTTEPAPNSTVPVPDQVTELTTPPALEPSIRGDADLAAVAEVGDSKASRDYDDFVAAALVDLEEWMTAIHPAVHGVAWEPLAGGVWPSYPGRTDIPGCGEATTDPADVAQFVAFYCAAGDFIVYDDGPDSLLGELAGEFGASVMGVVLAHEYAHTVQERTGDIYRNLPTITIEQQADCVAGAWVNRAATGESPHLTLGESDIRGALITMVAVRDPVGTNPLEPGGHGSAFDRIGAFQEGYTLGPERCAELIADPLPLMPNEFQLTTDLLNDGDLPFGYDDGQIAPLIVDTLNLFWPFQLAELGADSFPTMVLSPVTEASEIVCSERPRLVAPGLATCVPDGVVYLDDEFARRLYNDPIVGSADFAVGYFIALAWADIAQTRLGSTLTGSERSLANDCLVGAWTRDLDPDRPTRPDEGVDRGIISPGDLDEAVVAAIEIGDTDSAADELGTPFEKIDAFRSGVLGQIDACLGRLEP